MPKVEPSVNGQPTTMREVLAKRSSLVLSPPSTGMNDLPELAREPDLIAAIRRDIAAVGLVGGAFFHAGDAIEAGDQHHVARDDLDRVGEELRAARLVAVQALELVAHLIGRGDERLAAGAEEERVGRVEGDDGVDVRLAERLRPALHHSHRLLLRAGAVAATGQQEEGARERPGNPAPLASSADRLTCSCLHEGSF